MTYIYDDPEEETTDGDEAEATDGDAPAEPTEAAA